MATVGSIVTYSTLFYSLQSHLFYHCWHELKCPHMNKDYADKIEKSYDNIGRDYCSGLEEEKEDQMTRAAGVWMS